MINGTKFSLWKGPIMRAFRPERLTAGSAACCFEQDSGGTVETDQVAPLPAVISHLLFEPTLLASTGRRRFTLQNDTSRDLPVRWEISEMLSLQEQHQRRRQQPSEGSEIGFAPAQATGCLLLQTDSSPAALAAGTGIAELGRQSSQHEAGLTTPAGAAAGSASGRFDRDQAGEAEGTRRASRQEAGATARTPTSGRPSGRDDKARGDSASPARSLAVSFPGSSVVGATVVLPADKMAKVVAAKAPNDTRPFGIFPEFAVLPAHGEFTFEVAFSPAGLGESR